MYHFILPYFLLECPYNIPTYFRINLLHKSPTKDVCYDTQKFSVPPKSCCRTPVCWANKFVTKLIPAFAKKIRWCNHSQIYHLTIKFNEELCKCEQKCRNVKKEELNIKIKQKRVFNLKFRFDSSFEFKTQKFIITRPFWVVLSQVKSLRVYTSKAQKSSKISWYTWWFRVLLKIIMSLQVKLEKIWKVDDIHDDFEFYSK